jgi:predicted Zn-dependent protease with MMP-like domain
MTDRSIRKHGFSGGKTRFERWVWEAYESLPAMLKERLENVAILVEDDSPQRTREYPGEELLGLYHGVSRKDRGVWYGNVLPDRIIIYRKPLERMSASLAELKKNIRDTVIHEVGHYFGFEEDELRQLEGEPAGEDDSPSD